MRHIKRVAIYQMTSPTGKVYIGQSRDVTNRKSRYKTLECKSQKKLFASLSKYGFESHDFKILQYLPTDINQDCLNQLEIFCIQQFKEANVELLNIKEGGSNGLPKPESIEKLRQSMKGRNPWNKGKKTGQKVWNKGIYVPRKEYNFFINDKTVKIAGLKKYCEEHGLSYFSMLQVHNNKGYYGKTNNYMGYKRLD
jgi:group I intron endonuclease